MFYILKIFEDTKNYGWLRGELFEVYFMLFAFFIAILAYFLVATEVLPFTNALALYGLLLAQPHFIATYTRTAFSKEQLSKHRFEMFLLPVIVMFTLIMLYLHYGIWVYMSLYLYVQWFHFLRQSYGVSRMYRAKSRQPITDDFITNMAIYSIAVWGIIDWSIMAPKTYLGQPVKFFNIPEIVNPIFGAIAISSIIVWGISRYLAWRQGRLPVPHTIYVSIHIFMFWLCYIYIDVIEYGWMTIGIWHCFQYLLFVWAFNKTVEPMDERRYNNKLAKLFYNSVYGGILIYFVSMIILAFIIFNSMGVFAEFVEGEYFIPSLVIVGTLMFHHYVVDAIIWRRRKKNVS